MLAVLLAGKYARALFELAVEEKKLAAYGEELDGVEQAIRENAELASFLYNPQVRADAKKQVIDRVFEGELSKTVHNFIYLLLDKRRETVLSAIAREYKKLANEAQGIVEAEVTVSRELGKVQQEKLAAKLGAATGKQVVLHTKIDPAILGGVVVRIGDKLIDGSVMRRMENLKALLLAN